MQHFKFVNWWIGGFVFDVTNRYSSTSPHLIRYVLRADGSRINSKAIWFLYSGLFWSHQNSWSSRLRLFKMWSDNWSGLHEEVFAFTDGKYQKGEKDKGQEISKVTIHLRRWQIFAIFDPYPPTIGIPAKCLWFLILMYCDLWTIGTWGHPSPPKTCRRLKWMVP